MREVCDNADNDCDGLIDEDISRECGVLDTGICTTGTRTCTDGIWEECIGAVYPQEDICGNGIDEDCNGRDRECTEADNDLSWEAEEGTVVPPFEVKGDYIIQDSETGLADAGSASYFFSLDEAGEYIVKTLVEAADGGTNSFFVNMDTEPTDPYMIWDISLTTGFETRTVSWRGDGTFDNNEFIPKVFSLSAGRHVLIIFGRERLTKLDRLWLEEYSGKEASCGDGSCDAGEDCNNCRQDCGACQPQCIDNDNDGYGSTASSACQRPEQDCDDSNAAIHPGGTEICDNNVDEDCNGVKEQCASDSSVPTCTSNDWLNSDGSCQSTNTLSRSWTKTGNCQGGVSHPSTETVTCIYPGTSSGSTYYVSPSGSDSNPGTESRPWKTIQKAESSMSSGDTAIILPGSYSGTVNVKKSNINLIAQGNVVLNGAFYVYGNHNTVSGFEITSANDKTGVRTYGDYNIIENNDIHDTTEDGMWLWGVGNTIRGNYMHHLWREQGANEPFDQHTDCFMTWAWSPASGVTKAEDIIIEGNICVLERQPLPPDYKEVSNQFFILTHRSSDGPVDPKRFTFRNNIFITYDPGYVPIALYGDSETSGFKIYNNLFINKNQGDCGIYISGMSDVAIKNNIFYNFGHSGYGYVCGAGNNDISNNAVYNTKGVAPKGGPEPGDVWMQDPGFANSVNWNLDILDMDFHIKASSPLIDKGINVGVQNDKDGKSRPKSAGIDIGPYEYGN
ncbi:MAG: right-handed parallel beta-helix repeat-containing protein [Nanoarchaeota archaeon]|nr:right-handed parallel beta-helix repeat-containing protein [Nanoarchaeota archaeon]